MGACVTGNSSEDKRFIIQVSKYMFACNFPSSLKVGILAVFKTVRGIGEGSLARDDKCVF